MLSISIVLVDGITEHGASEESRRTTAALFSARFPNAHVRLFELLPESCLDYLGVGGLQRRAKELLHELAEDRRRTKVSTRPPYADAPDRSIADR